jgi:hypothetical protein
MPEGVFLYFVPDKSRSQLTQDDLAGNPFLEKPFFELIHSKKLFSERLIGPETVHRGPEGKTGCVIAIQPAVDIGQIPSYSLEKQTWQKIGNQWIGYQTDLKPGPESLRRTNKFQGYEVELGDNRIWCAPVLRAFDQSAGGWSARIPLSWGLGANGELEAKPVEKYRELWEASLKIVATVGGGGDATFLDCFEWAVNCVSVNYRVGAAESSILGLFDDDTIRDVLHSAVDIPMVEMYTEKDGAIKNPT